MIVHPSKTPLEGTLVKPSCTRNYRSSGNTFSYEAPECRIVSFDNAFVISGSEKRGMFSVVQGNKIYYDGFSKEAYAFRQPCHFWDNYTDKPFKLKNTAPVYTETEIFAWFNIGLYWHWFLEDLPLVVAFKHKPGIPIYTNKLNSWQLQSLKPFPDILSRLVEVDTPTTILADKVNVVTYPALSNRGRSAKWVAHFLRDNLVGIPSKERKRYFISRSDAQARRVVNEDAVVELLSSKYGFERLVLGGLSLQEKLNAYASADIIVTSTGANLTHVHQMKPGTTVIDYNHSFEIAHECGWNNIGDACGINWITKAGITKEASETRQKRKNNQLKIPLQELDTLLEEIIDVS